MRTNEEEIRYTIEQVEVLAQAAMLGLSHEEKARLCREMSGMLALVTVLEQVPRVAETLATAPVPLTALRQDEARAEFARETVLGLAPEHTETMLCVPRTVEVGG